MTKDQIIRFIRYSLTGLIFLVVCIYIVNQKGCALPEVKQGKSDTVITKIFVHDTLHDTIPHDSIRVVPIIQYRDTSTQEIIDSMPTDSTAVNYVPDTTAICYEVKRIEKDSARINVAVCSDSLPKHKPLDLSFKIDYLPAPRIEKTIFRTDSILKFKPIYQNWQLYAIAAATFALGMYAAHR